MKRKIRNSKLEIRNLRKGFTLVELLVVISIIGLLVAVLVANFMGARERAQDSQKIQDLNSIKSALRLYYNDNQAYYGSTVPVVVSGLGTSLASYIPGLTDTVGAGATYISTADGDRFFLCTSLSSAQGDNDVDSQKKCGLDQTPNGLPNNFCGWTAGVGKTQVNIYVVCAN